MRVEVVSFDEAARLNRAWHSRLPRMTDRLVWRNFAACGHGGIAYAVAIWSHPVARLLPQDTWLELRRLAIAPDAPKNTASWMIGVMTRFIRKARPEVTTLVSYQDMEVHTGGIYRAAGWTATAKTEGAKGNHHQWNNPNRARSAAQSTAAKQRWEKVISPMNIKSIKRGLWYETKQGIGECLAVGGTHPPSVQFNITHPFPRGRVYVVPRDVIREVPNPTPKAPDKSDPP